MTNQWIFIRAHDAWMFRDSKPFSAGQNFYARSMFPPHPGTMQGVIRSHYLEMSGVNLAAFGRGEIQTPVGTPSSMGNLTIQGPFLARMHGGKLERLVRTPFDVLKGKSGSHYAILSPARTLDFVTDAVPDHWRPPTVPQQQDGEQYEDAGGWLTEDGLRTYLGGTINPDQLIDGGQLFVPEERVGLAINYQRRTNVESQFYRAQFIRPRDDKPDMGDTGLLVGLNQNLFQGQTGLMRIGGESRCGVYEVVTYQPPTHQTSTRIKLVLLTPTYFSDGWQPAGGDWTPWLGSGARLISMIIGKPLAISGWNLARRSPKPLRHLVPAGSVYYFECPQPTTVNQAFTETPQGEPAYAQMGFGAVAVGTWNYA